MDNSAQNSSQAPEQNMGQTPVGHQSQQTLGEVAKGQEGSNESKAEGTQVGLDKYKGAADKEVVNEAQAQAQPQSQPQPQPQPQGEVSRAAVKADEAQVQQTQGAADKGGLNEAQHQPHQVSVQVPTIKEELKTLLNALDGFFSTKYSNSIEKITEVVAGNNVEKAQDNRIKLKDLIQSMCAFLEIAINHLKDGQALIDAINAQYTNSKLAQEVKEFKIDLNPNEQDSSKKKSIEFKTKTTSIVKKIDGQKIESRLEIKEKEQNDKNKKEIEDKKSELLKLLNGEQDFISSTADKISGMFKKDAKPAMNQNIVAAKADLIDDLYQVTISFTFEKDNKKVVQKCTLEDLKSAVLSYEDEFANKNFSNNAYRVEKGVKSAFANALSNLGITDAKSLISVDENDDLLISSDCLDAFKYFLENEAGNCMVKNGEKNEKKSIDDVLNTQNSTSNNPILTLVDFTPQTQGQMKK